MNGAAQATNAYVEGDLEMAANAQASAERRARPAGHDARVRRWSAVINPGAIPQIPGDMGVLGQHAAELTALGARLPGHRPPRALHVAGPGRRSTPRRSRPSCSRPPGRCRRSPPRSGRTSTAVGGALSSYATEVDAIKTRLEALQDQASAFEATAGADPDWREDEGQVDRHNQLLERRQRRGGRFPGRPAPLRQHDPGPVLRPPLRRRERRRHHRRRTSSATPRTCSTPSSPRTRPCRGAAPRSTTAASSATSARSSAASGPAPSRWSRASAR